MSREIKIHLPEAACDALATEAKAAGRSFFDHCRAKLLEGTTIAVVNEANHQAGKSPRMDAPRQVDLYGRSPAMDMLPELTLPKEPDRIDRLEAMMMQMADTINNLANPQHFVQAEPAADIDVDDVVNQSLETADRYGVAVDREQAPASSGGIRPVGQRMVSRLAVGVPTHVAGLFPT